MNGRFKRIWLKSSVSAYAWGIIGVTTASILFVALGILSWFSINESIKASNNRKDTYDAILLLDRILKHITEAEGAQRGYVLTGNDEYLTLYVTGSSKLPEIGKKLSRTVVFDKASLYKLKIMAQKKFAEMNETIRIRRENGEKASKDLINQDVGFRLMIEIRSSVDDMRTEAMKKVDDFDYKSKRYASITLMLLPIVGGFNMVLVVLAMSTTYYYHRQRELSRSESERAWTDKFNALREKERVEQNLDVANQQFQRLVENVHDYAIFLMDPSGVILTWNSGAEQIKGYREDEIIGRNFSTFYTLPQLSNGDPARALEFTIKNGQFHDEGWRVRRDGSEFWASTSIASIRDHSGKIVRLIKVTRDLTLRRQHELEIQKAESLFRTTIDLAPNAVIVTDGLAMVKVWNCAAVKMFGYEATEILGKSISVLIPERFRENHIAGMNRVIANGKMTLARHPLELSGLRRDGSEFQLEVTLDGTQLVDEWIFFAVLRDTTSTREAEREMYRLNRELQQANEELRRSNDELDQFASIASHDLRSPLRQVVSYTQLLGKRYGDKLDDDGTQFIRYIVEGATRMQNLINDLLTFAKVGSGEWKPTAVDTNKVIEIAIKNLSDNIIEKNADVQCVGIFPLVLGDENQLIQVFQNLISNAIKFSTDHPIISISSSLYGIGWEFCVRDNGIGIPSEYIDQIWTMFRRLNGSEYQGTGIGLSIVKKVVERHHGTIRVESIVGLGSAFFVTLPVVP